MPDLSAIKIMMVDGETGKTFDALSFAASLHAGLDILDRMSGCQYEALVLREELEEAVASVETAETSEEAAQGFTRILVVHSQLLQTVQRLR